MQLEALVNLQGKMVSSTEAKVSVMDRSYLYGDSLYEVVRTYQGGKAFAVYEHLERLKKSAELASMNWSLDLDFLASEIQKTIQEFRKKDSKNQSLETEARLVLSRGIGGIGFSEKLIHAPNTWCIIAKALPEFTEKDLKKGQNLKVSHRLRNPKNALDPAMKSGNYLNSLLAYLDAEEEGYDDALLLDREGYLTEGTTFNVFYYKRGCVITPPLEVGILAGITRSRTLEVCRQHQIPILETRFKVQQLLDSDEAFITGTKKEIQPILSIDRQKIGSGQVGPFVIKLRNLFRESIQAKDLM